MAILTPKLESERKKIKKMAESVGLDFFETIFELVTHSQLNEIAACGGFPVRYPHWKWGMEYERLSKNYEYGLSKIYELVINTNPCYAYLMEGNQFIDQKLVMAHVYGHSDFFKNNQWFRQTDTKMLDTMANHATKVRKYQELYGQDTVETFIDNCLSLENLIDPYHPYSKVKVDELKLQREGGGTKSETSSFSQVPRQYLESFRKPLDRQFSDRQSSDRQYLEKPSGEAVTEKRVSLLEKPQSSDRQSSDRQSSDRQRDILGFLLEHAPLKDWEQDVLSLLREESYYFAPQRMTKVMNEGWASFWHSKIMTEGALSDSEIIDFADRHSGAMSMAPHGFNPYKVGIELFRNIQERWDKGQFGLDWDECDDIEEKKRWDRKTNQGMEKIYQVRRDYNDVTFIDEFLTKDFCVENKMFVYKLNPKTQRMEIDTRDFDAVKSKLLFQLTNMGQPIIYVDGEGCDSGGILLEHLHEGVDMQPDAMRETMKRIHSLWKKPIWLSTVMAGEKKLLAFDGKEHTVFPRPINKD